MKAAGLEVVSGAWSLSVSLAVQRHSFKKLKLWGNVTLAGKAFQLSEHPPKLPGKETVLLPKFLCSPDEVLE